MTSPRDATPNALPLNCDRDAARWAREFNDVLYKAHGIYADDGLLIAWFANAMMCGEDTYRWRTESETEMKPKQNRWDVLEGTEPLDCSDSSSLSAIERTPADYAIEHGEYLARAADAMVEATNNRDALAEEECTQAMRDATDETYSESLKGLRSAVYEFRKRAERVSRTPSKSEGISEAEALRLAAISTASLCNTRESAKQMRIGRDHPYWTQAYEDVCEAVEREMALREELKAMQSATRVTCPECDVVFDPNWNATDRTTPHG